jgi:hypothetical protein
MPVKRRGTAARFLAVSLTLLVNATGASTESTYSPWWGTDCHFVDPETLTKGLIQGNGHVSFRRFPVTPQSIDEAPRTIGVFDHGITFRVSGSRFTAPWRNAHIQIRVVPLGVYHSAVAMTALVDGRVVGDGVFGNMELTCWRPLEDLIERYSPGSITGSPPRPQIPLHDQSGNVVPEPPQH